MSLQTLKKQLLCFIEEQSDNTIFLTTAEIKTFFPSKQEKEMALPISTTPLLKKELFVKEPVKEAVTAQKPIPKAPAAVAALPSTKAPSFKFDYFTLLEKIAPQVKLSRELPSDAVAKKMATLFVTRSKTPEIPLLYTGNDPLEKRFLENLAFAISKKFHGSAVVDVKSVPDWEEWLATPHLRQIIATKEIFELCPDLLPHYLENTATKARALGNKPLCLIDKAQLYLKSPLQKQHLWTQLCQLLKQS